MSKDYFGYTDKICVVTGVSSGIGKSVATMLIDLNANVYGLDINECNIEGVNFIKCDLSSKESIDDAFKILPEKIDSFFGVAGLSGAITNYYKTFTVNYIANKYITEEYLKVRMPDNSSISYVTSVGGLHWEKYAKEYESFTNATGWNSMIDALHKQAKPDTIGMMAYPLSKRAMNYYMAEQAIVLGERGIRVNALLPGSTDTGMKKEFEVEAGGNDKLIAETGVAKRLATPEEMAEPLVFLNSDMARFISGFPLIVDSASNAMINLGMKKDRLDTKVGMKIMNSKFMQNMLKKQLEPLNNKDEKSEKNDEGFVEPNTTLLKQIDDTSELTNVDDEEVL